MDTFVALLIAFVLGVVLALGVRWARPTTRFGARRPEPAPTPSDGRLVIVLDLDVPDPSAEPVQRLADEAAARALASSPDVVEVEVRARTGMVILARRRQEPRAVSIPDDLYQPRAGRSTTPTPTPDRSASGVLPGVDRRASGPVPSRPLADRFQLPPSVRERLGDAGDADDAVALVQGILDAAGCDVVADGDLLRCRDAAVIVIRAGIGEPVSPPALSRAFRRFQDSGAGWGIVVTPGFMDPLDVRRREMFAPALLHAGPDGIQRMADAAAAGSDPIRFAAAPALAS